MANTPPPTPQPLPRRVPQCTHMRTLRLHGEYECQFCGKIPSLGFIYICCQDLDQYGQQLPPQHIVELSKHTAHQALEAKAFMAEGLGMRVDIVEQLRRGVYSDVEIDLLFAQRRKVVNILYRVLDGRVQHCELQDEFQHLALVPGSTKAIAITADYPPCDIQVCHSCKPYLKDRLYVDPTALAQDIEESNSEVFEDLPVRDSKILKNMVLPGEYASKEHQAGRFRRIERTGAANYTPVSISSSEYSESSSEPDPWSLKLADWEMHHDIPAPLQDVTNTDSRRGRAAEPVTPYRFQLKSGPSTDSPITFSDTSSFSIADSATSPLTPLRHGEEPFEASFERKAGAFAKSASFCGPFTPHDLAGPKQLKTKSSWSHSSRDSNDHFDHGIAVTEESVQTGIPDIITT